MVSGAASCECSPRSQSYLDRWRLSGNHTENERSDWNQALSDNIKIIGTVCDFEEEIPSPARQAFLFFPRTKKTGPLWCGGTCVWLCCNLLWFIGNKADLERQRHESSKRKCSGICSRTIGILRRQDSTNDAGSEIETRSRIIGTT